MKLMKLTKPYLPSKAEGVRSKMLKYSVNCVEKVVSVPSDCVSVGVTKLGAD
jgi:hypothetical protein